LKLKNCKNCGTLFAQTIAPICNKCLQTEQEDISKISKFVFSSQKELIPLEEISDATEISIQELEKYYSKGRLVIDVSKRFLLSCKSCGCKMKENEQLGFFCKKCSEKTFGEDFCNSLQKKEPPMVELRTFVKDVMHSKYNVQSKDRQKYGFKNYD